MEDKADKTFFADESKDPFTFGNSKIYSEMIPIEDKSEQKKEKKSGFFQKKKKIRRKTMDSRTDKFMKLMEQLGADIDMPDEFEFDSPDEEVIHEWDELEGGGMDET